MANSIKPMRLAKAAREFNVGVHTIQDFLKKKGYDDDFKPNSKLDADMVALLMKEYQSEKEVKEKADEKKLSTERTPLALEQEESVVEEVVADTPQEVIKEDDKEESLAISDSDLSSDNTSVEEEVATPETEVPQPEENKEDEKPVEETPEVVEDEAPVSVEEAQVAEEVEVPAETKAAEVEPVNEAPVVEDTPEPEANLSLKQKQNAKKNRRKRNCSENKHIKN